MTTKTRREADSFGLHSGNGGELLTKKQIAHSLKLSSRSIDRKISRGEFPKGMKIGSLVRWPKSLVDNWVREKWEGRFDSERKKPSESLGSDQESMEA